MSDVPMDPIAIDVHGLLQSTVTSLYSHLVTRQTGRAVRLAIEARLADAGEWSLSLIDLTEVSILDFSCADEVVAKLLQKYQESTAVQAFFVFRGVHEPHREQIEYVLDRQALAAVAETGSGAFELLGAHTPDEGAAWAELERRGFTPPPALAGDPASRAALEGLVARRLAFRSPVSGTYHALSRLVRDLV